MNRYFNILFFIGLLLLTSTCQKAPPSIPECDEDIIPTNLAFDQELFLEIAFDQEFGQSASGLRKWEKEILIFAEGKLDNFAVTELNTVLAELNGLNESGTSLTLTQNKSDANLNVFFGTKADYVEELAPEAAGFAEGNSGFVTIAWNQQLEITRAIVCVDNINNTDQALLRHIIREEMAQALGLINDTFLEENTIFYEGFSNLEAYSAFDKKVIGLMLGNELRAGMCVSEVLLFLE
ncbi:MAG: DUF2927 domain-containing protein [Bacteroidota bacterium]